MLVQEGHSYYKEDMKVARNPAGALSLPSNVGFLLIDRFGLMTYASIVEPFRAANVLSGRTLYNWRTISVGPAVVHAASGDGILVDTTIKEEPKFEILFVCAGGNAVDFRDQQTFAWLRRQASRGGRIVGVSGGPFLLARAGLLAGRRCTVHWEHLPAFREEFTQLRVEDKLYVVDGRRMTCAGGSAGMDLALQMIASDHNQAISTAVSDWYIKHQLRDPTSAQRMSARQRYGVESPALARAFLLMENNIAEPLSCAEIARRSGMSVRHLERLFVAETEATMFEQYKRIRLRHAAALLRETDLSATEIAVASGFTTAAHFSRSFSHRYGVTPRQARRRAPNLADLGRVDIED